PTLLSLLVLLTCRRRTGTVLVRSRGASIVSIRLLALLARHAALGALLTIFIVRVRHRFSPSAAEARHWNNACRGPIYPGPSSASANRTRICPSSPMRRASSHCTQSRPADRMSTSDRDVLVVLLLLILALHHVQMFIITLSMARISPY